MVIALHTISEVGMNDADFADLDAWKWGLAVIALIYGFIWLGLWRRARLRELEEQGPFDYKDEEFRSVYKDIDLEDRGEQVFDGGIKY